MTIDTCKPDGMAARLANGRQVAAAAFCACIVVANAAVAADTKPFAAPQVAEHAPVSTAGSLAQVTVSLLLVLAAVFLAAWVMRKLRGFGSVRSDAIKIVADLPLGAKERAVLIQVGSQQLLLGVTAEQINTLHAWPEGEGLGAAGNGQHQVTVSEPAPVPGTAPQVRPDFKSILKRSLGL